MNRKASLADLRKAGHRHPRTTWLFNQIAFYVVFVLVGILAFGLLAFQTSQNITEMQTPPVKNSEYLPITIKSTPATNWAETFMATAPTQTLTSWNNLPNTTLDQPYTFNECPAFSLPPATLQHTYTGTATEATLILQLYTPGDAQKAFTDYKATLEKCWTVTQAKTGTQYQTPVYLYEAGAAFTYGDAILFIKTDNLTTRDSLVYPLAEKTVLTLKTAECLNLQVSNTDNTRNLYTNKETYTGLLKTENITTTVTLGSYPSQIFPQIEDTRILTQPENPLPTTFPLLPQKPFEKPQIPSQKQPAQNDFTKSITYQVTDDGGPGCGWVWSGFKAPVLSVEKLTTIQTTLTQSALNEVNNAANTYISTRLTTLKDQILIASSIEEWNSYIQEVKIVNEKWQWLNVERDKLRKPWQTYVTNHDSWVNFDNQKANAQITYTNAVNSCTVAQQTYNEWYSKWNTIWQQQQQVTSTPNPTTTATTTPTSTSTPTSTGVSTSAVTATTRPTTTATTTPTGIAPPPPPSCNIMPSPPLILETTKPLEPQPPTVPTDVTIPASWPTPITSPTVELIS